MSRREQPSIEFLHTPMGLDEKGELDLGWGSDAELVSVMGKLRSCGQQLPTYCDGTSCVFSLLQLRDDRQAMYFWNLRQVEMDLVCDDGRVLRLREPLEPVREPLEPMDEKLSRESRARAIATLGLPLDEHVLGTATETLLCEGDVVMLTGLTKTGVQSDGYRDAKVLHLLGGVEDRRISLECGLLERATPRRRSWLRRIGLVP